VGARTRSASATTSIVPVTCITRVAFSGELDVRWSSLNADHRSREPSGMNCAVKTCRKLGSSRPQPNRASSSSSRCRSRSSSVRARTSQPCMNPP
jgi:hypothetical protein